MLFVKHGHDVLHFEKSIQLNLLVTFLMYVIRYGYMTIIKIILFLSYFLTYNRKNIYSISATR